VSETWGTRLGEGEAASLLIPAETCSLALSETCSGFQSIHVLPNCYVSLKKLLKDSTINGLLCIFAYLSYI